MATDPTDPTPAMSDPQTPKPRPPPSPVTTTYLFLYNFISTILWFSVLGRVLLLLPLAGHKRVYGGVGAFTRNTQTLAALEIFHSLFGVVRAPLATTVMQLSSRLLLVWGVVWMFERETAWRWAYCSMLVAWSVTEVIRYCYFACQVGGRVPGWLKWLR
ncbi:MAG: hypothetical protein M1824_001018 [Vezdaea acicularis]|nr:MAG: hypothetical protein M1824_001018 [Vezdaea acicularis]